MANLSDASLPMGLVFLAMTVFGFLRKKSGHAAAVRDYPKLALELGLAHRPSPYKGGIGQLVGELEGRKVIVDPDDQRAILVRFMSEPGVEILSYSSQKRPKNGLREERLLDAKLRSYFPTVHLSPAQSALLLDGTLLRRLLPMLALRERKALSITSSGVKVQFDYGSPPYIPAPIARDVLRLLLDLAEEMDLAEAREEVSE